MKAITQKEKNTVKQMVNDYGIIFPQELISRVENDHLKQESNEYFDGLTSEEKCFAFVWLSNAKNAQKGLAGEITSIIVSAMMSSHKDLKDRVNA